MPRSATRCSSRRAGVGSGNRAWLERAPRLRRNRDFAAAPIPAAFGLISGQSTAYANANTNNPAANPLAPLRALQFLPPFQNVPNAVEPGRTHDHKFTYTIRLAYDFNEPLQHLCQLRHRLQGELDQPVARQPPVVRRPGWRSIAQPGGQQPDIRQPLRRTRERTRDRRRHQGAISAGSRPTSRCSTSRSKASSRTSSPARLRPAQRGQAKHLRRRVREPGHAAQGLHAQLRRHLPRPEIRQLQRSSVGDLTGTAPGGHPQVDRPAGRPIRGSGRQRRYRAAGLVPLPVGCATGRRPAGLPGAQSGRLDRHASGGDRRREALPAGGQRRHRLSRLRDGQRAFVRVWARNLLNSRNILTIFDSVAQPHGISGYPTIRALTASRRATSGECTWLSPVFASPTVLCSLAPQGNGENHHGIHADAVPALCRV